MCIVTGGHEIPDGMINHNFDYLNGLSIKNELQKHLICLLILHPEELKKQFFELYCFDKVNVDCIKIMDDECVKRIITEIDEILGIQLVLTTTANNV